MNCRGRKCRPSGFGRSGTKNNIPGFGRGSRMVNDRQGLYRSRSGVFLGVCRGIAEYFDFPVGLVRALTVVFAIFTGFWPILGLYLLAALVMKLEPVVPIENEYEEEFYESFAQSRSGAISRLKRKFENLDRRIRRMEDVVTSKEYDWDRRFRG